jgi:outer membrane protein
MKRVVAVLLVVAGGLLLVAPIGSGQQAPPAGPRIAFIDLQRVLVRSAAGVAAREQLEKERAGMQKEIDARRQEIEKLREELDKKGALLTADARREKEELLDRKRRDATRMADDFQRELAKKEQQLGSRVLQELSGVIERVGKQRGYFLIVERRGAGILYSAPEADLTDEIIRVYDQESAAKGGKK